MDVTPIIPADRKFIDGYGPGEFQVSGEVLHGALLVFPDRVEAWPVTSVEDLAEDSFASLAHAEPPVEVLLLGCGRRMALIRSSLRATLRASGVVVEPMDTGAACRTYNVLLAEGRRVAAALIPV